MHCIFNIITPLSLPRSTPCLFYSPNFVSPPLFFFFLNPLRQQVLPKIFLRVQSSTEVQLTYQGLHSWGKLTLIFLAGNNFKSLHSLGWDCVPSSLLHAGFCLGWVCTGCVHHEFMCLPDILQKLYYPGNLHNCKDGEAKGRQESLSLQHLCA